MGIVDALDPARLRLLVEVGRRGSISAAADVCRIGQPSATKHLQTLEAAVGSKLVERHGDPAERAFIETLCSCCSASVAGCIVTGE